MRTLFHPFRAALLCMLFASAVPVFAQPLADRVPADSLLYVGWNGTETMPAAYEGSHLKAIVENSKVRELVSQFLPALADKLSQTQPQARQPMELAKSLLKQISNHPTAFWFSGIDMANPNQPMPKFGIICRAGNDAAVIQRQLNALTAGSPIHSAVVQDLLVVTIGYPSPEQAMGANSTALAQSASFTSALKQVPQPDPMVVVYVDYEKILGLADIYAQMGPPQVQQMVSRVLDALGVRGLKYAIATSGFDGKDWMSQSFVSLPAPRTGLFEGTDNRPISPELLKAIPADATFAATGRFNPGKLIAKLRTTAGQIDPQAGRMVEQVFGAVQLALGVNPVDVLDPLGDDWAAYCSPSVSGNSVLGLVIVNKLTDPAKAARTLPVAWTNLSNWANVALARARAQVEISGRTTEIDGTKIYYAGVPVVAPAWAIKDGYLYMGLFPQSVGAGARWTAKNSDGKSITASEKFIALQKRLNVTSPASFSFYDLPVTGVQGSSYGAFMVLGRYAGFADLFGIPLPEPLIPPLDLLQQHLTPAGSMAWVDDAGIHEKAISPFPGSRMLSEPGMFTAAGPASVAFMTSILLPSLNRSRETANRVRCAANLKSLGQGMMLYANENQGAYPPDLGTLAVYMDGMRMQRGQYFICPSGGRSIPPNLAQMAPDQYAAWVNDNSDYVYVAAGMNSRTSRADTIVIYEKPEDHTNDGMNMLYGDGHVDFSRMPQAMDMIQRQMQRGGR